MAKKQPSPKPKFKGQLKERKNLEKNSMKRKSQKIQNTIQNKLDYQEMKDLQLNMKRQRASKIMAVLKITKLFKVTKHLQLEVQKLKPRSAKVIAALNISKQIAEQNTNKKKNYFQQISKSEKGDKSYSPKYFRVNNDTTDDQEVQLYNNQRPSRAAKTKATWNISHQMKSEQLQEDFEEEEDYLEQQEEEFDKKIVNNSLACYQTLQIRRNLKRKNTFVKEIKKTKNINKANPEKLQKKQNTKISLSKITIVQFFKHKKPKKVSSDKPSNNQNYNEEKIDNNFNEMNKDLITDNTDQMKNDLISDPIQDLVPDNTARMDLITDNTSKMDLITDQVKNDLTKDYNFNKVDLISDPIEDLITDDTCRIDLIADQMKNDLSKDYNFNKVDLIDDNGIVNYGLITYDDTTTDDLIDNLIFDNNGRTKAEIAESIKEYLIIGNNKIIDEGNTDTTNINVTSKSLIYVDDFNSGIYLGREEEVFDEQVPTNENLSNNRTNEDGVVDTSNENVTTETLISLKDINSRTYLDIEQEIVDEHIPTNENLSNNRTTEDGVSDITTNKCDISNEAIEVSKLLPPVEDFISNIPIIHEEICFDSLSNKFMMIEMNSTGSKDSFDYSPDHETLEDLFPFHFDNNETFQEITYGIGEDTTNKNGATGSLISFGGYNAETDFATGIENSPTNENVFPCDSTNDADNDDLIIVEDTVSKNIDTTKNRSPINELGGWVTVKSPFEPKIQIKSHENSIPLVECKNQKELNCEKNFDFMNKLNLAPDVKQNSFSALTVQNKSVIRQNCAKLKKPVVPVKNSPKESLQIVKSPGLVITNEEKNKDSNISVINNTKELMKKKTPVDKASFQMIPKVIKNLGGNSETIKYPKFNLVSKDMIIPKFSKSTVCRNEEIKYSPNLLKKYLVNVEAERGDEMKITQTKVFENGDKESVESMYSLTYPITPFESRTKQEARRQDTTRIRERAEHVIKTNPYFKKKIFAKLREPGFKIPPLKDY